MRRFSDFIDDMELVDPPLCGSNFTWVGAQENRCMSRIDRFLFSSSWEEHFSNVAQFSLPRPISDHIPILLDSGGIRQGSTPFRFKNMWLLSEGFADRVGEWWGSYSIMGTPSFVLAKKLELLKEDLCKWNSEVFGRLEFRKGKVIDDIRHWDGEESEEQVRVLTEEEKGLRNDAKEEFGKIAKSEEISWRQKSRKLWLKEGERNTRFFHRMANCNRRNNFIGNIKIGDSILEREEEKRVGIANFYEGLFTEMGASSILEREEEKRVGIANFYEGLFTEMGVSRPRVDDLNFDAISEEEAFWILQIPTEELQHWFETEVPDTVKQPSIYARNFLEFCSYQALHLVTTHPDYLSDKEFRRLTYDMMLAWEAPGVENEPLNTEIASCSTQEMEGEDGWSLFYSSSTKTAVQVDNKKTVGPEAFARIAPACAVIADIITVHNLFDALTSSSSHRLHFLIYDKYLRMLEKVIKAVKNARGTQSASNLQLAEGEFILDVDGTVPTQPVLQHVGISAWPGRLTLTNYALYFESLGVGLYEKAVRYDLAMDMKQVIRPDLTGPLGARLFDKAVMYKSTSIPEPVFLEFPEFKGNSRRDYWLYACLEILHVHGFIRKYNLKGIQQSEALARAILGIFRYRAAREAFQILSSHYKTLLCFNLAESLPGGDMILETLSSRLVLLNASTSQRGSVGLLSAKEGMKLPVSVLTLHRHGILGKGEDDDGEAIYAGVDVCAGEIIFMLYSITFYLLQELLFPLVESFNRLQVLASWKDPWKSTAFLVSIGYTIFRGWIRFVLPSIFVILAVLMNWRKHANNGRPLEAYKITVPPTKNAVEQLLSLQEAITQVESLIQAGNIVLLKVRALLIAALPQATERVAMLLVSAALFLALIPLRLLILLVFIESFTREMPLRKASSDRWLRRVREWWFSIPAAPVHLIKADDKKRK
ncbi:hypothetical protein RHGRI_033999 [Rhododendron griersonianum]|uniref:DUF639 domain-containing protein n=1 Tax=Rhododendron griersonianum TaxID=479676 RepID=A0AAV6HYU9_9ERIC|nr:hypothetical protein RHGRI_033999 [Rhododendron griersonianum]